MQTASRTTFTSVRTEGAILPADLLQRVARGDSLDGLKPYDYHLQPGARLNEAISRAWSRFDRLRAELPESDAGTTLTRERWLLVLFEELGYNRLQTAGRKEIDGTAYPISHLWGRVPIHLVTFRQDLDRRSTVATAVRRSPYSLMQEFLNRSEGYLWGLISNGLRLRILRDNVSLTRAAYVEFDLETMMRGEQYADFALLWMICHQSRVEGDHPPEFWLERWSQEAAETGTRALDSLRNGVQRAIEALGQGLLSSRNGTPLNPELVQRLRSGGLTTQAYYRQLPRLVYRLNFLCVAEDRELLLRSDAAPEARETYNRFYSIRRLRDLSTLEKVDSTHVVLLCYWVPEEEVALRCAEVPPFLISAFRTGDAKRVEDAILLWLAGYNENHGNLKVADGIICCLFSRAISLDDQDEVEELARTKHTRLTIREVERRYPLGPEQFAILETWAPDKALDVARIKLLYEKAKKQFDGSGLVSSRDHTQNNKATHHSRRRGGSQWLAYIS